MSRAFLRTFLLGALALGSRSALAACSLTYSGTGSTPVVQYDPIRGTAEYADLLLRFTADSVTDTCQIGIDAFDAAPGSDRQLSQGSSRLLYRIFTADGAEVSNSSSDNVGVSLPTTGSPTIRLRVEVPAGQMGPAGTYQDGLTIRLFDLASGGTQIGGDIQAIVTASIEARAEINIAGSSVQSPSDRFSYQRLDFGSLVANANRQAMVQIRTTAPVTISVESQNNGELRLTPPVGQHDGLPYRLMLDGETLSLAAGSAAISRDPAVQAGGVSYPLSVTITGNPDLFPAGDYQDLLTISVSPR